MVLHHVGVVVKKIDRVLETYHTLLGMETLVERVHDPIQKVNLCFLQGKDGLMIELIEPADEDSPVARAAAKGGGLNHLCYVVDDIEAKVEEFRGGGSLVVCEPVPAVAFSGRRVAFVVNPKLGIIEFVERAGPPSCLIPDEEPGSAKSTIPG